MPALGVALGLTSKFRDTVKAMDEIARKDAGTREQPPEHDNYVSPRS